MILHTTNLPQVRYRTLTLVALIVERNYYGFYEKLLCYSCFPCQQSYIFMNNI